MIGYDPIGYYKPVPILGNVPTEGLYYGEYPTQPEFYVLDRFDAEYQDLEANLEFERVKELENKQ